MFAGVVCIVCFTVGLIFCTGAGEYWLTLFDSLASTIGLVVVALMEMISVIFIYGHEKSVKFRSQNHTDSRSEEETSLAFFDDQWSKNIY